MKQFIILVQICMLFGFSAFAQKQLRVNGFLNQAYAFTDGNTIYGITEDGTYDYRSLALQFRYEYNQKNLFVVQFNHRRQGIHPLMAVESEVGLDWAFFRYSFSEATSIKIGKILLPYGIYNEIRDVGVILPFYQAPKVLYDDGRNIGETLNGILLNQRFDQLENWEFDVNLYSGSWDWQEWERMPNFATGEVETNLAEASVNQGFGLQLWVNTPLEGVRIGGGSYLGDIQGGVNFSDQRFGTQDFSAYYASFDATRDRFMLRSEYSHFDLPDMDFKTDGYYIQAGVQLFGDLELNAMYQSLKISGVPVPYPFINAVGASTKDVKIANEYIIGFNYRVHSNLVFKIEGHRNRGYSIENQLVNIYLDEPYETLFTIFSMSTSF